MGKGIYSVVGAQKRSVRVPGRTGSGPVVGAHPRAGWSIISQGGRFWLKGDKKVVRPTGREIQTEGGRQERCQGKAAIGPAGGARCAERGRQ